MKKLLLQVTNISSGPLPLYWYWLGSFPLDPATGTSVGMTWNNSDRKWEYTSSTAGLMTAETITPATYIQLSQTDFGPLAGVNPTDSLPAYYLGLVGPGDSVLFTWDRKLTDNITSYSNSVTILTGPVPVPEASSILLLGGGLLASLGMTRRKFGL